jgi:5-methylcytosine-specific restriction endonuclease McrA
MKSIQIEESKLRFLLENKTKKEVAELFGCCVETLRKRCLEYGIESDKPEYNIEIVKALFSEKGCELLETEYINNKHPMNYRCVCGTLSKIQLNKFLSGQRCKECKRRKFIGENNHKWNPNKTDDDRKEDRKYFEYIQWTKQVMARDGYICQICKKHTDLNVHHLYSYDKHVDKRLDPDNGISLCESCHKLFHQKYGYGNNTREQFINQFLFHLNEISEFEFTNVTEKCALDVYDFLGCGNSKEIDRVATDSIRVSLNNILFSGRVVLCEGEKDGSFGLFNEKVGKIDVPCLDIDIVCDPVDGSTRSSNYQADACCILCLASKGCFYIPKTHYMKKLVMRENLYMTLDKTNLLEVPVKELAKNISEVLQRKPIVSLLRDWGS